MLDQSTWRSTVDAPAAFTRRNAVPAAGLANTDGSVTPVTSGRERSTAPAVVAAAATAAIAQATRARAASLTAPRYPARPSEAAPAQGGASRPAPKPHHVDHDPIVTAALDIPPNEQLWRQRAIRHGRAGLVEAAA